MSVVSYLKNSPVKGFLLFLAFVSLSFFVSQYLTNNYGLPQWITLQIKVDKSVLLDVYYDIGEGYSEKYKVGQQVTKSADFQTVRLRLPSKHLKAFRIDPLTEPGIVYIRSVDLSSLFRRHHFWSAADLMNDFRPLQDIRRFELANDSLLVESKGSDPYFVSAVFIPHISKMNRALVFVVLMISLILSVLFIKFVVRRRKGLPRISPLVVLAFIIIMASFARSYHITYPLNDTHAFRQTQTAGLIRDYYREGIDLLHPKVITLGNPGYVILEFPLYQACASLLYRLVSPNILWARLLSIFFGVLSIVFVYRITKKSFGETSALFASFFFAFTPLTLFYNRVPMPDSLTILLSLIMVDFLIEGINEKRDTLLVCGIIAGSLGMIMKSPFVAPLYLPVLYAVYQQEGRGKVKSLLNVRLLSSVLIPSVVMVLWQRYANSVNEFYFNTGDYPFKELYSAVVVKLRPFNSWYFGTVEQRLDLKNYLIILQRISQEILSVAGIFFFAYGLVSVINKKARGVYFVWLAAILCSMVVILKLNVVHDFYQLPLTPILAIFCGAGAVYFIETFKYKRGAAFVIAALLACYLFASCSTAKILFRMENNLLEVGQFIATSTESNAMIATSQKERDLWDPVLMYYSDRRGFDLCHKRLNEEMIEYLRDRNIKYLAVVDYDGKDVLINIALEHNKIVAKNDRTRIFDISPR